VLKCGKVKFTELTGEVTCLTGVKQLIYYDWGLGFGLGLYF